MSAMDTYLFATDDDGHLDGDLFLEALNGSSQSLALGTSLDIVVLKSC
jgi:hypothetical protein